MGNIEVRETFCNETENYTFGDSEWYETFTDNKSELFRAMQKDYGRVVSKMYIDTIAGQFHGVKVPGPPRQIGWVFSKKMAYEDDAKKFYVREVWVEVRNGNS